MMNGRPDDASDAGFTLVEALVSLFIFALVAGGGVAMLAQSVSAQREIGTAHEALRALQTTRAILDADLAQIAPRSVRLANDLHAPIVVGDADGAALTFVRAAPVSDVRMLSANRLVRVRYVIEGDRLLRRLSSVSGPEGGGEERVLLSGAGDLRFSFFDGVQWVESWAAAGAPPPRAVALTARLPRYGEVRVLTYVGLGE